MSLYDQTGHENKINGDNMLMNRTQVLLTSSLLILRDPLIQPAEDQQ